MKKIIVIMAIAIALVAGLAAEADAAKKKPYVVSISVSATSITVGTTLKITGSVSPKASGQTVTIQKKLAGGKWKTEKKVTIKADGTYAYSDVPTTPVNRQYRTYKPKKGKNKKGYSKTVAVKVAKPVQHSATLTITATGATTLDAGQNVSVVGTASANLKGKKVLLQRLNGSSWQTLATGTVSAASTFSVQAKATVAGADQRFRVQAPATSTTKVATSGSKSFTVYGWLYLNTLTPVSKSSNFTSTRGTVAEMSGVSYTNSLRALWSWGSFGGWTTGEVQYNLGGHCRAFDARIGVDDTSGEKAAWNFTVTGDSVESAYGFVGLGQSRVISTDVTSVLRLKLNNVRRDGTPWQQYKADAVWASARVNCAF